MKNILMALGLATIVAASGVAYAQSSSSAPGGASASSATASGASAATGKTVWDGVFTDAQADNGASLIGDNCSLCHGNAMRGSPAGPSVIANLYPMFGDQPLTGLFEFITTQMPKGNPGSLTPDEYAAITARILQLAGAPSGSTALPSDDASLDQITLEEKK